MNVDRTIEADEDGKIVRVIERHERGTVVWRTWRNVFDGFIYSDASGEDGRVFHSREEVIEAYGPLAERVMTELGAETDADGRFVPAGS